MTINETEPYGVPNLEFEGASIDGDHASTELDTNGEIVDWLEPLVSELQKQA